MNFIRFQLFQKIGLAPAVAAFALALTVPTALAHARPVAMTSAPDQVVSAPDAVKIAFGGAVERKFSKISVTDAAGHWVTKGAPVVAVDAKTIAFQMPKLAVSVYTVNSIAVAVDSHREQRSYKFTVK